VAEISGRNRKVHKICLLKIIGKNILFASIPVRIGQKIEGLHCYTTDCKNILTVMSQTKWPPAAN
jgi:hypothetical protein